MKLQLKHLAPYLPYGLMYQLKGNFPIKKGEENIIEDIREINAFNFTLRKVLEWETCKPILRPLNDLTNEIEIDGEKFYPNDRIWFDVISIDSDSFDRDSLYKMLELGMMDYLHFIVVQKLFEWHFDVFGLIPEGLAIDINTLKL